MKDIQVKDETIIYKIIILEKLVNHFSLAIVKIKKKIFELVICSKTWDI